MSMWNSRKRTEWERGYGLWVSIAGIQGDPGTRAKQKQRPWPVGWVDYCPSRYTKVAGSIPSRGTQKNQPIECINSGTTNTSSFLYFSKLHRLKQMRTNRKNPCLNKPQPSVNNNNKNYIMRLPCQTGTHNVLFETQNSTGCTLAVPRFLYSIYAEDHFESVSEFFKMFISEHIGASFCHCFFNPIVGLLGALKKNKISML